MRFGSRIWRTLFAKRFEFIAGGKNLNVQEIIANKCDDLPISVQGVFAKHCLGRKALRVAELLQDEVDCFLLGCHGVCGSSGRWLPLLIRSLERRFSDGLGYTMVRVRRQVLANLEDCFEIVVRSDAAGELRRGEGMTFFLGEVPEDPALKIDDCGGG